jgi:hypothetical protein
MSTVCVDVNYMEFLMVAASQKLAGGRKRSCCGVLAVVFSKVKVGIGINHSPHNGLKPVPPESEALVAQYLHGS